MPSGRAFVEEGAAASQTENMNAKDLVLLELGTPRGASSLMAVKSRQGVGIRGVVDGERGLVVGKFAAK